MPPRLSARAMFWWGVAGIGLFLALWLITSLVTWNQGQFGWLDNPGVELVFLLERVVGQVGAALVAAALLVASVSPRSTTADSEPASFPPRLTPRLLLGSGIGLLAAQVAIQVVFEASIGLLNWFNQLPLAVVHLVGGAHSVATWLAACLVAASFAVRSLQPAASPATALVAPRR